MRALYGLQSARTTFQSHLADCIRHLGYESNEANPDLWMKVCTWEPANGPKKYYSYILLYIDHIPYIHDDPDSIFSQIDKYFPLKSDEVDEPDVYLGDKLNLMQLEIGVWVWGISQSKYV